MSDHICLLSCEYMCDYVYVRDYDDATITVICGYHYNIQRFVFCEFKHFINTYPKSPHLHLNP